MSAIVGTFHKDGRPVDPGDLERMMTILAHRGPDACGTWSDGPVGLGHRLLQTTPESLDERQPLADPTGDLKITADARLDNRDELLAFRRWLREFDSDEWDRQIEEDVRAGKLDKLAEEAIAAHRAGKNKEL